LPDLPTTSSRAIDSSSASYAAARLGSPLHRRLTRLWLGIAVFAALFMVWIAWLSWQDIRAQSQEQLRAFAAEYAIEWRSTLHAREDSMQRLRRGLQAQPDAAQQQLDRYLHERPDVEGVALVNASGQYVARSGVLPPPPTQDTLLTPPTRAAYAACLKHKTFCLGPPIPDHRAQGSWMALEYLPLAPSANAQAAAAQPLLPEGGATPLPQDEWLVLAQASVFPRALGLLQPPGEGMAFVVLRADGLLQLRFPPPTKRPYGQVQSGILLSTVRAQPQSTSGVFSGMATSVERHLVGAYVRVPDYPFVIGADLPTRSLLERWAGQLAGTLLLFFGLIAAGSWLFASALRQLGRTERSRELALEGLRRQRDELDVTLSSIGDAVITTDGQGRISRMNPEAARLTGWAASEAMGQPVEHIFRIAVEGEEQAAPCPVAQALGSGRVVVLANHTELHTRDGRLFAIEDSAAPITGHAGDVRGAVLVFHDVSDRRERQRRNERLKSLYAALAELGEIVQQHARQGDERALFRSTCEALAASKLFNAAWIGRPDATGLFQVQASSGNGSLGLDKIEMRLDDAQPALAVRAWLAGELRVHNDFPSDPLNLPRRDFVVAHRWHSIAAVPLLRAGRPEVILVVTSATHGLFQDDVRELIARIARLLDHALDEIASHRALLQVRQREQWLALHDTLTHLPNRNMLESALQQAIERADANGTLLALAYLDLDGFKSINDVYGHLVGDQVLRAVAERLRTQLPAGALALRMGGDEFVIILEGNRELAELEPTCLTFLDHLRGPMEVGNPPLSLQVDTSCGITIYPYDRETPDTLLRHADMALYAHKSRRGLQSSAYRLYDPAMASASFSTPDRRAELRRMIDTGDLVLHYQPVLDCVSGRVHHVEALARLRQDGSLLQPDAFLRELGPMELNLLGTRVRQQALADLAAWVRQGLHLGVSVNVAPQELLAADFSDQVLAEVAKHPEIEPGMLSLEILETEEVLGESVVLAQLRALRAEGVRIGMDDVGSAYASLLRLKTLPVDLLKIDQAFVRDLPSHPRDRLFLDAILALGQALGMRTVIEGVETREHLDLLWQSTADGLQGFAISPAIPPSDIPAFVARFSLPPRVTKADPH
jgi:diguanylate cyclase (GGDEF)-like protein/PAS domain S-box-containing protein